MPREAILGKTAYEILPKELADIYASRDKAFFESVAHENHNHQNLDLIPEQNDGVFNKSVLYKEDNSIAGFLCMVSQHKMSLPHESADELKELTHRELEVFNLLVKGQSVKAMARVLNISTHTIADHLKVIYRKLGVHSKNEAIYKGLHLFMTHPWQLEELENELGDEGHLGALK